MQKEEMGLTQKNIWVSNNYTEIGCSSADKKFKTIA